MLDSIEAERSLSTQVLLGLPEQFGRSCHHILQNGLPLIQVRGSWSWSGASGYTRSENRQVGGAFKL